MIQEKIPAHLQELFRVTSMTIPPEFRAEADSLSAPLRALLDAELAAGNSIAQVGSCFPAPPVGAYVTLTNPITTRSRESGGGVFYRFINSLNSHSFSDERQFYFVLGPALPPPPEPHMDAIREAHLPKNQSNYTSPFDPDSAGGRFRRGMELDYVRWRDGDGYDLDAIADASPADRAVIEALLLPRGVSDWRDVDALAALATPGALAALESAWSHGSARIRTAILTYSSDLIAEADRIHFLVEILETASLDNGLSQAIDLAEECHPQPVIDALLRGTLRLSGEAAVNFAGLLMFLHGKAESAFDWDKSSFFARFNTDNRQQHQTAFLELCAKIGVDPSPYL